MKIDINKNNQKFLFLLLSADLLFIFFHIGNVVTSTNKSLEELGRSVFSLGKDLGLAESFMYVQEFWLIILLAYMAWNKKAVMYFAWSLLFFYIIFDDLFQLHERIGFVISQNLELEAMFNLRAQDFGELAFTAVSGFVLLSLIAIAYWKSDNNLRRICHHFIFLLFSLVVFGVLFDMVQIMFHNHYVLFNIFGVIEDGGEMIIMSFFCWYVYLLSEKKDNKSPFNIL